MQFIRANMFYVVLVAAALVVNAGILVVGSGAGKDADVQLARRVELDGTLSGFERGPAITRGAVTAQKARVAKVEEETKVVEKATLDWNRGDCPMFESQEYRDENKQPFPAFRPEPAAGSMPPDKLAKWREANAELQASAHLDHTLACISLMRKLVLEDLRSTTPPTAAMIVRERDARLRQIKVERVERERMDLQKAAPAGRDAMGKPDEERRVVHQDFVRMDSSEARAETDARNQLTLDQSEKGYIYADLRALRPPYVEAESLGKGARARLWNAWVQYRVCRDITGAIRETITGALKGGGKDPAKATVPQSPIKRLVDVQVSGFPGGSASYSDARTGPPSPEGTGGRGAAAASITGRISNTQYDVVRYQFTVVMADTHVAQLIEQLYRRNDHFVLSVQMERVEAGGPARAPGAVRDAAAANTADTVDESLCYYGVEPVMRVTVDGEVLMRTSWCRDLMPIEVLESLKTALPTALRPQDATRLSVAATGGNRP